MRMKFRARDLQQGSLLSIYPLRLLWRALPLGLKFLSRSTSPFGHMSIDITARHFENDDDSDSRSLLVLWLLIFVYSKSERSVHLTFRRPTEALRPLKEAQLDTIRIRSPSACSRDNQTQEIRINSTLKRASSN